MNLHHVPKASIKAFNRLSKKEQNTLSIGMIVFVAIIPILCLLSLFMHSKAPYIIVGSMVLSAFGSCLLVLIIFIHHHLKNKHHKA